MNWRTFDSFPEGNGSWQYMRAPFHRIKTGRKVVERALRNWNPIDPIIVATPDCRKFLPPICIPSIAESLHKRLIRNYRNVIAILLASIIINSAALSIFHKNNQAWTGNWVLLSFLFFIVLDFKLILKNVEYTAERALFVNFVYQNASKLVYPATTLMIIAGCVQIALQFMLGGLEPLIMKYGILFSATDSGEWWRFIVGPFFHNGLIHWAGNLISLTFVAAIASVSARRSLLLYFIIISSLSSAAVAYISGYIKPDYLVGVSGGIFGLFGWIVAVSLRYRGIYPTHFWLTVLLFSSVTIFASSMISNASNIAHLSGFFIGVVFGIVGAGVSHEVPKCGGHTDESQPNAGGNHERHVP